MKLGKRVLSDNLLSPPAENISYLKMVTVVTFDAIYALIGFLISFGYLVGIGINKPRGMSVKTWCFGYLGMSIAFDALVIVALAGEPSFAWLTNILLGLSAGAATGLALHVAHHISEEDEHEHGEGSDKKEPSMLGF